MNDKTTLPEGIPTTFSAFQEMLAKSEQSPLQKAYNLVCQDEATLTDAIMIQMKGFVDRKLAPTFDNMAKTRTWTVMAINLTDENRQKYETRWREIEAMLELPVAKEDVIIDVEATQVEPEEPK